MVITEFNSYYTVLLKKNIFQDFCMLCCCYTKPDELKKFDHVQACVYDLLPLNLIIIFTCGCLLSCFGHKIYYLFRANFNFITIRKFRKKSHTYVQFLIWSGCFLKVLHFIYYCTICLTCSAPLLTTIDLKTDLFIIALKPHTLSISAKF